MSENSSIIICGQRFDISQRVITWQDDPSINAYTLRCVGIPDRIYPTSPAMGLGQVAARFRERRLLGTDRSLSRLNQIVRQFVVHLDGMGQSRDTFKVLHDERGLSVHFMIDNNGDVYQTLDLMDCAFHAAGVNEISVGVEIANRGDASGPSDFYKGQRDKVTCTVNGHQILCYVFTEAQLQAMVNIGRCLARVLPGIALDFPRQESGEQVWATLASDPREFTGYYGHFHTTQRKWDPGPFDFKKFIAQIRSRTFYPALPHRDNVEVPETEAGAAVLAQALYDNNEREGEGGYYPVGSLGASKLWHGGVHLRDERGQPVLAPFAGKIVAARLRDESDWPSIGSNNMVLLRHDMGLGQGPIHFWTLLMHLDAESPDSDTAPAWLKAGRNKPWFSTLQAGDVALLDETVSGGDIIGHFGEAGPPGARSGQIHFAVFSEENLGMRLDPTFWAEVDGTRGGRFCFEASITAYIDLNHNNVIERKDLIGFFRDPSARSQQARETFRKLAVRHLSEWTDRGDDFLRALWQSPEIRALVPAKQIRLLYEDQIQSMFWWTAEVEQHAGLPQDQLVWSYHPVTFVLWLRTKLQAHAAASKAIESAEAYRGEALPKDIKGGDLSEGGEGFIGDEDALFGEAAKKLTLEQLAAGYPD